MAVISCADAALGSIAATGRAASEAKMARRSTVIAISPSGDIALHRWCASAPGAISTRNNLRAVGVFFLARGAE